MATPKVAKTLANLLLYFLAGFGLFHIIVAIWPVSHSQDCSDDDDICWTLDDAGYYSSKRYQTDDTLNVSDERLRPDN